MRNLGIFLLLVGAVGVAWGAGVRVHPEAVGDYLPFLRTAPEEGDYRTVKLTSGTVLTGIVTRETSDTITLAFEGGEIILTRNEIVSIQDAAPDARTGDYVVPRKKAVITYEPEHNFFARFGDSDEPAGETWVPYASDAQVKVQQGQFLKREVRRIIARQKDRLEQ